MSEKHRDLPPHDTDGVSVGPGLKPVRPPRTPEERAAWGRMKPVEYQDSLGKRAGGWLVGWLTAWKR